MYRILIVDDEPLVQVGLRSMIARSFQDRFKTVGAASNGQDALKLIESEKPDIVITDIKMPLMNGIELMKESHRLFGQLPVFIMLTAYEEFELARQAMAEDAVDYLVKLELSEETLGHALSRGAEHADRFRKSIPSGNVPGRNLEEYRQKFFLKLISQKLDEKDILAEAGDLGLDFHLGRFIAVYCVIQRDSAERQEDELSGEQIATLCSSCCSMTEEIISRYIKGRYIVNDLHHFTILFCFGEEQPVAALMNTIEEAILNAQTMIRNYFGVCLHFGIGTAVSQPSMIPDSYEEAVLAASRTTEEMTVLRFSHIVGSNRRSGKDRLIASIQKYIDDNLNGRLLLNEVAEKFGLSPAYLSVIFKKSTEVGFSEYVNNRKIEKAKELLLSGDMKIYEAADALGFESAYYFSKVFKKVDGHSPREYIQMKLDPGAEDRKDP